MTTVGCSDLLCQLDYSVRRHVGMRDERDGGLERTHMRHTTKTKGQTISVRQVRQVDTLVHIRSNDQPLQLSLGSCQVGHVASLNLHHRGSVSEPATAC